MTADLPAPRPPPVWVRDLGRRPYRETLAIQRALRAAVQRGEVPDTLLLVEHDPVVTLGQRGDRNGILSEELLALRGIDLVHTERGGNVTYHGPGQIVAYPIVDLQRFQPDLRWYVERLEGSVIRLLHRYRIVGFRDPAMHGVFTDRGKIASIGVHVSRWVTMHGVAINIDPDMAHWDLIAPCGQPEVKAASLAQHGVIESMENARRAFLHAFAEEFAVDLHVPADVLLSAAAGGPG